MIETISIREMTTELRYKDQRSTVRWCRNHNLSVLQDEGNNRRYTIKEEFEAARMKMPIKYLSQKYGADKLPDVLNAYMKFQAELQSCLDEKQKLNFQIPAHSKTQHEMRQSRLDSIGGAGVMLIPMEPLQIPPNKKLRGTGIQIWCTKCQENIYGLCKDNGQTVKHCTSPESHRFKIYMLKPGTQERITRTLQTRSIDDAIIFALQLKKELSEGRIAETAQQKSIKVKEKKNDFPKLTEVIEKFVQYKSDQNTPSHMRQELSPEYLDEIKRAMKLLEASLEQNENSSMLRVNQINDQVVGVAYDYLSKKGYKPAMFNKTVGFWSSLITWYNQEHEQQVKNRFQRINRKKEFKIQNTVNMQFINRLFERITYENGFQKYDKGKKPVRNVYKPWIKKGILLAYFSGRRRNELADMRWDQIIYNETGEPESIVVADQKVNNIQKRKTDSEKKVVFVPIIKELRELLDAMEYEKYKNTHHFILAPELDPRDSRTISDSLSRAFSHYARQVDPTGVDLKFGVLRKSYITKISIQSKGNAKLITGHSGDQVVNDYYNNRRVISGTLTGVELYSDEARLEELGSIRTNSKTQNKSIEK